MPADSEAEDEATDEPSASPANAANDLAIDAHGKVVNSIINFHNALREMTGRRGLRDEISRYEAMAMALVRPNGDEAGTPFHDFPSADSLLNTAGFFATLYQRYEERFVLGAPMLGSDTVRYQWHP